MATNDEFIREVDEEYRRDQIVQIWKRYNGLIIGIAILLVAAVGGWRYWEYRERVRAEAAAEQYEEALKQARAGNVEESQKTLEALAKEAQGGYGTLSRFRLAAELGKGSPEEGAKAFDALASDASLSETWQGLARLRAAMLRMDQADSSATVRQNLEGLATPTGIWRHTSRELLGLSGLKAGDMDYAGRWFDQIAADRDTPPALRQRLQIYTALVAGGPVQVTQ
jgi:hypothetical protein